MSETVEVRLVAYSVQVGSRLWPVLCGLALTLVPLQASCAVPETKKSGENVVPAVAELETRRDLPHTASDGSTPAQIRSRYIDMIQKGDVTAAADALKLIRTVIDKEDGLYSSDLAKCAEAALKVNPDLGFVMLLVRHVPKESVIFQNGIPDRQGVRPRDPKEESSEFISVGYGDSQKVLREVPGLATPAIMDVLTHEEGLTRGGACHLLWVLGYAPPRWEDAKVLLKLLARFPDYQPLEERVNTVLGQLYSKKFPPWIRPINVTPLSEAMDKAEKGDVEGAWKELNASLAAFWRKQGTP